MRTSANVWKFTGEQNDVTVNQSPYYLRARYYDPVIGRFLTRDPFKGLVLSPDSLNAYAYADNDPAVVVDPWGLCSKWPPNNWGDCPQKAAEKAVSGAEKVASGVEQGAEAAGEYLSDPDNLATVQNIALITAFASCEVAPGVPGAGVVCAASVITYFAAGAVEVEETGSTRDMVSQAVSTVLGVCDFQGSTAVSNFWDVFSPQPTPALAPSSESDVNGCSAPPIGGEKVHAR